MFELFIFVIISISFAFFQVIYFSILFSNDLFFFDYLFLIIFFLSFLFFLITYSLIVYYCFFWFIYSFIYFWWILMFCFCFELLNIFQKHPVRDVLRKRCSKNMLQIYRKRPVLKCDFNKVAKQSGWESLGKVMIDYKLVSLIEKTLKSCILENEIPIGRGGKPNL